jgi:hypothetical protein
MEVHPVLVQVSWTMSMFPGFFMEFIWKSLESMENYTCPWKFYSRVISASNAQKYVLKVKESHEISYFDLFIYYLSESAKKK